MVELVRRHVVPGVRERDGGGTTRVPSDVVVVTVGDHDVVHVGRAHVGGLHGEARCSACQNRARRRSGVEQDDTLAEPHDDTREHEVDVAVPIEVRGDDRVERGGGDVREHPLRRTLRRDQTARTNSAWMSISISFDTTIPPLSRIMFHVRPQSSRLIVPRAPKTARSLPHGSVT